MVLTITSDYGILSITFQYLFYQTPKQFRNPSRIFSKNISTADFKISTLFRGFEARLPGETI